MSDARRHTHVHDVTAIVKGACSDLYKMRKELVKVDQKAAKKVERVKKSNERKIDKLVDVGQQRIHSAEEKRNGNPFRVNARFDKLIKAAEKKAEKEIARAEKAADKSQIAERKKIVARYQRKIDLKAVI